MPKSVRDIGSLKIANGRFAAFTPSGLVLVADTVRRYPWRWVGEPPVLHLRPAEILAPRGGWQSASITTDGRQLGNLDAHIAAGFCGLQAGCGEKNEKCVF